MKRWIYPEENIHKILRVMAKGEERESKILRDPAVVMSQPTHYCNSPVYKLTVNQFATQTGHRKAAITEHGLNLLKYLDAGYAWDVKENKADFKRGKQKKEELAHVSQYAFTTGPQRTIRSRTQKHDILRCIQRAEEKGTQWTGGMGATTTLQQLEQNVLIEQSRPSVWSLTDRGRAAIEILDNGFSVSTIRGIDTRIPKCRLEDIVNYLRAWFEEGKTGSETNLYTLRPWLPSIKEDLAIWDAPVSWLRKNKQYLDNDKVIELYDTAYYLLKKYANGSAAFVETLKEWIQYEKHVISNGLVSWESIEELVVQVFTKDSDEYDHVKKYFMRVKLSN